MNSDFGDTESDTSTPRVGTSTIPLAITAHKRNSFNYSLQRVSSSQSSLAKKSWFLNLNILQASDAHAVSPGHERKLSSQSRMSKPATPSPTKASKFTSASAYNEIDGFFIYISNHRIYPFSA